MFLAAVARWSCRGRVRRRIDHWSSIKDSTITGKDVKNRSRRPRTSAGRSEARAATRAGGPRGRRRSGRSGRPVGRGQTSTVQSPQVFFGTDIVKSAAAYCPAGQRAISGGGASISDQQIAATAPTSDRAGWFVIGVDEYENGGEYVQAYAVCAPAGQAVAASNSRAAQRRRSPGWSRRSRRSASPEAPHT